MVEENLENNDLELTDIGLEDNNTTPEATENLAKVRRIERRGKQKVQEKAKFLQKLQVQYVPISNVFPNEYNPNRQSDYDFEMLLRSIEEDGFTQPILANTNGVIIDGEHRWRAARVLGMREIPVVYTEMTPEQMRISTVRHNRARGTHDIELEADLLRDLQQLGALGWAQESLMLDDVELNRLINDVKATSWAEGEFSEAWEINVNGTKELAGANSAQLVEAHDKEIPGGQSLAAHSVMAADNLRAMEKRVAEAKTSEEVVMVKRDYGFYTVNFVYSGEEATVIKKALGDRPAQRLLELCKQVVLSTQEAS